jgi:thiol-disulfide isomerase/thioredoxin
MNFNIIKLTKSKNYFWSECFLISLLLLFFEPITKAQNAKIKGWLPGKESKKIFIDYLPPNLGKAKFGDSCIIDAKGNFEFIIPFNEPVLAALRFDYEANYVFVTDTGTINIRPFYKRKLFDFLKIEAVSKVGKQYKAYQQFIKREFDNFTKLLEKRDRFRADKKGDSMKFLEPLLEYADSMLLVKNVEYVNSTTCCPIIKSLIIYRKLMLHTTVNELNAMFRMLEPIGQNSMYGKAVMAYVTENEALKIGTPAPIFTNQKAPNGNPISLEKFKGKYLLIDFWASWCVPCRAENPNLVKLYAKYKNEAFEILGISLDEKEENWVRAIAQDELLWQQASDLKFWNGECVKLYNLYSLPSNILIDKMGNIIGKNLSVIDIEAKLKVVFK